MARALTVTAFSDADAQERDLEGGLRGGEIGALVDPGLDRPFGIETRFMCAFEIDLGSDVGRLGHHDHPVRTNLHESAEHSERLLGTARSNTQLTCAEH